MCRTSLPAGGSGGSPRRSPRNSEKNHFFGAFRAVLVRLIALRFRYGTGVLWREARESGACQVVCGATGATTLGTLWYLRVDSPSKDGNLHIAGRSDDVQLAIVAEIMNAKLTRDTVTLLYESKAAATASRWLGRGVAGADPGATQHMSRVNRSNRLSETPIRTTSWRFTPLRPSRTSRWPRRSSLSADSGRELRTQLVPIYTMSRGALDGGGDVDGG